MSLDPKGLIRQRNNKRFFPGEDLRKLVSHALWTYRKYFRKIKWCFVIAHLHLCLNQRCMPRRLGQPEKECYFLCGAPYCSLGIAWLAFICSPGLFVDRVFGAPGGMLSFSSTMGRITSRCRCSSFCKYTYLAFMTFNRMRHGWPLSQPASHSGFAEERLQSWLQAAGFYKVLVKTWCTLSSILSKSCSEGIATGLIVGAWPVRSCPNCCVGSVAKALFKCVCPGNVACNLLGVERV